MENNSVCMIVGYPKENLNLNLKFEFKFEIRLQPTPEVRSCQR